MQAKDSQLENGKFDQKLQVSLNYSCPPGFRVLTHFEDEKFKGVELIEDNVVSEGDGFDMR